MWADLPRRVLTISIGIPVILSILKTPHLAFYLIQFSHVICAVEWVGLTPRKSSSKITTSSPTASADLSEKKEGKNNDLLSIFACFICVSIFIGTPTYSSGIPISLVLSLSHVIFTIITIHPQHNNSNSNSNNEYDKSRLAQHFTNGFLFLSLGYYHLHLIYNTGGIVHSLQFLFIVWNSDSGALIFGRTFQGDPLGNMFLSQSGLQVLKNISAKKSFTGMVGAVVFGTLTSILLPFILPHIPMSVGITLGDFMYTNFLQSTNVIYKRAIIGFILSLFAVMGDLVESIIKRSARVKDSGKLLPGHGGVLDRMDSILPAAGIYYFILKISK